MLLAVIAALIFAFWRRIVLRADSIEVSGMFGAKKYLRSDIKRLSRNGDILLKGNKKILRPLAFNFDHKFKTWVNTSNGQKDIDTPDDQDAVEVMAKLAGVSKGKAGVILFAIIAIGIGLVGFLYNRFPGMHMLGLYVISNVVGILLVFGTIIIFYVVGQIKRKNKSDTK
jgi:hypothetical protein